MQMLKKSLDDFILFKHVKDLFDHQIGYFVFLVTGIQDHTEFPLPQLCYPFSHYILIALISGSVEAAIIKFIQDLHLLSVLPI